MIQGVRENVKKKQSSLVSHFGNLFAKKEVRFFKAFVPVRMKRYF